MAGAEAVANQGSPIDGSMSFMIMFNIVIAIYILYYAFKGTGRLYDNEFPQDMQEAYRSMMRKFCWVVGIGLLILSVLEYIYGWRSPVAIVSICYILGCVAAYFVIFRVKFKSFIKKPDKNGTKVAKSDKKK
ncbi:MAG: hypothetical protein ACOYJB_09620 [Christensenellaceae bacterium]|jgi:hypothetical protein